MDQKESTVANYTVWINRHTGARACGIETKRGLEISDAALNQYAKENFVVGFGDGMRHGRSQGFNVGFIAGVAITGLTAGIAYLANELFKKEDKEWEK